MTELKSILKLLLGLALLLVFMTFSYDLYSYIIGNTAVCLFASNIRRVYLDLFVMCPVLIASFYFIMTSMKKL